MCNYFCCYAFDGCDVEECIRYLISGAGCVKGFFYRIKPLLAGLPDAFKKEGFGMKRGYFAICMYLGDYIGFPYGDVFKPGCVYVQHLYTQDSGCRAYFAKFEGIKRPRDYGTPGVYTGFAAVNKWCEDEEKALRELWHEDMKRRAKYMKDHEAEIARAKETKKRCEQGINETAVKAAMRIYHWIEKNDPDRCKRENVYEKVFYEQKRKIRNSHPFVGPMDMAERVLASIPDESPEYMRRKEAWQQVKRREGFPESTFIGVLP